jgi:D-alanyl-lipoteichoic acid acyltransferase DltB (MBOAT superfamily)
MAFSDPRYLLFLGFVAVVLFFLPRGRWRLLASILVGFGFYACLNPAYWYALIVVASLAYAGGIGVSLSSRQREVLFTLVILLTSLPLLIFKYASTAYGLLPPGGETAARWSIFANLILPIGISFYTFLAVGYLIDVFVGNVAAERDPLRFGAFMMFFPHLTAGPIERTRHLLPQIDNLGVFDYGRDVAGLRAILVGLFMKVVIAETLAPYVDTVYSDPRQFGAIDLALATVYFSFQVYADFAGYSLIAIGSARLLGIELLTNFNQPYLSQNLPDYWRRWHISLSSWFRDYVFTPLQFQARRLRKVGLAAALVFTFVLVGIWHGAGWKYAIFGLVHGVLVAYSTLTFSWRDTLLRRIGVPRVPLSIARAVVTFCIVTLTFVLFRASGVNDALWIYGALFKAKSAAVTLPVIWPALLIAILVAGDVLVARGYDLTRLPTVWRWTSYYLIASAIIAAIVWQVLQDSSNVQQFIYFKF